MIDEEQAAELFALRDSLRKAERDFEVKDKVAKAAKKRMEAEQKEFNEYVDDLENPTPRLPFKADEGEVGPILGGFVSVEGPEGSEVAAIVPDPEGGSFRVIEENERWRLARVENLLDHGLSAADIKKLQNANPPIKTLGDMADFSDGDRRLVDIPGIAEKTADRITDALIGWHQAHPEMRVARESPVSGGSPELSQDALGAGVDGDDVRGSESPSPLKPGGPGEPGGDGAADGETPKGGSRKKMDDSNKGSVA